MEVTKVEAPKVIRLTKSQAVYLRTSQTKAQSARRDIGFLEQLAKDNEAGAMELIRALGGDDGEGWQMSEDAQGHLLSYVQLERRS